MAFKYTAKMYCDDKQIAKEEGNDVDDLYTWMIAKAEGKFGSMSGEIIDNKTGKSVRSFRKAPSD